MNKIETSFLPLLEALLETATNDFLQALEQVLINKLGTVKK